MRDPHKALDIQLDLQKNGYTQTRVARELGVTQGYVSRVIAGDAASDRVEKAIAEIIGRPLDEVPAPQEETTQSR